MHYPQDCEFLWCFHFLLPDQIIDVFDISESIVRELLFSERFFLAFFRLRLSDYLMLDPLGLLNLKQLLRVVVLMRWTIFSRSQERVIFRVRYPIHDVVNEGIRSLLKLIPPSVVRFRVWNQDTKILISCVHFEFE